MSRGSRPPKSLIDLALRPAVALPAAAFAGVLSFMLIFAPSGSSLGPGSTVIATQIPTNTPGPSPTPGPPPTPPPSPTPEPGAADRDARRAEDLELIARALSEFHRSHGAYPDTGDSIQTLCVYEDLDAGCALKEYLDPLPAGPLKDSARDGYWYQSDGKSYVVFAVLESRDADPPCKAADAAFFERPERVYCVVAAAE